MRMTRKSTSYRMYTYRQEHAHTRQAAVGDITEDAPNYNRIDLTFIWLLADLLGTTEQLRTGSFRSMFRRFSAQVSFAMRSMSSPTADELIPGRTNDHVLHPSSPPKLPAIR